MKHSEGVPFVALQRQYEVLKEDITSAFERIATSGAYVLGHEVEEFEAELAKICDVPFALTVANGTDALVISLKCLNIGPGDEVITPPNSFIGSTACIVAVGATPVFADVEADGNINPKCIVNVISDRTRAILPVHLTGRPAKMDQINEIAKKHNLIVI